MTEYGLSSDGAYFVDAKNAQHILESFLKTKKYSVYLLAKAAHTLGVSYFTIARLKKEDILPVAKVDPPNMPLTPIALKDKEGCLVELIYRRAELLKPLYEYWNRGRLPRPTQSYVLIKFAAEKMNVALREGTAVGFNVLK